MPATFVLLCLRSMILSTAFSFTVISQSFRDSKDLLVLSFLFKLLALYFTAPN